MKTDLDTLSQIHAQITSVERELASIDGEMALAVEDLFFFQAFQPNAVKGQEAYLAALRGQYFVWIDELTQLLCKRDEIEQSQK